MNRNSESEARGYSGRDMVQRSTIAVNFDQV